MNTEEWVNDSEDISKHETRKRYIDTSLKNMGWRFDGADSDVIEEYEVENMAGVN